MLVADEPTTALDVTVQAGILDVLRDLRDRLGTSILVITHDLGVIADVADRVVVMYAGRVVERAGVDELFARPQHHYTAGLLSALAGAGPARRHGPAAARSPAWCRSCSHSPTPARSPTAARPPTRSACRRRRR